MSEPKKLNGQQKAEQDVQAFKDWMNLMTKEAYVELVHRGKLKRKTMADQAGVLVGQLTKNTEIIKLLAELEDSLRADGILPQQTAQGKQQDAKPTLDKESVKREKSESRVPALEQKILELESENAMLKGKLGRFSEHIEVTQELAEL
jgi:hypothetical protein